MNQINEMKNGINIYTTDEEPLHYFYFMKFCNYLEKIYDSIDYIINNHSEIYNNINNIVVEHHIY